MKQLIWNNIISFSSSDHRIFTQMLIATESLNP